LDLFGKMSEKVSEVHGGQSWRNLKIYKQDFSVTTNALGTPEKAIQAAREALNKIEHYPPQDFEPALTDLAKWLDPENWQDVHERLLLGNGLSELIDLVIRTIPKGSWQSGPSVVQYMEYERSASAQNRPKVSNSNKSANLTCIINPNNPTGDWMPLEQLKSWIEEHCIDGSTVLVDESMLPWEGPNWKKQSLISARDWILHLLKTRDIKVYPFHSWTKIWACPGLRMGSLLAPTKELLIAVKKIQVPWSLNTCALAFISEVVKDEDYMKQTWELTPKWRAEEKELLLKYHPNWKVYGESWLSWLWVEVESVEVARKIVKKGSEIGYPIRAGEDGYNQPNFVRLAVRKPEYYRELLEALKDI